MSSFTLTLDTHAPVVTWGPPTGTDAGEELHVPYLLDESGIETAELELRDGRVLPMDVLPGELVAALPVDTPEGPTTVRAYVKDDVWNEAWRTLTVPVTGVPWVQPAPPVLPSPPQRRVRRIVEEPSVATIRAVDVARAVVPTITRLGVRSRYLAPDQRTQRYLTVLRTTAAPDRSRATVAAMSGQGAGSDADVVWRRPEGPGAEEDFILLDLL